jgi:hypothetical protein
LNATLAGLYEHPGPFVTIYLNTESAVENAAARLETRWKDVVRELDEAGVDGATIDALSAARGGHELGGTRVLVAAGGRVLLALSLPENTDAEVVRVSDFPYLLPLLDWAQTRVPHLVVLTNREGADILAYVTGADPVESGSVDSGRHPSHKTGIGGWSEHRYQRKVEENWKASARDVAQAVERFAADIDPQVIAVAGDVHAVDGLKEHIAKHLVDRIVVIDGGRAVDGSDAVVAEEVLEAVAARLRDDTAALMADFAKYRDRAAEVAATHPATDGTEFALNAANGVRDVVAALQKAQVGTLLLATDLNEGNPLFYGPAPTMLATSSSELEQMGVSDPVQAPLVDVLLRAALGTGADIRMVPAGTPDSPDDGVGALLRYSDSAAGPAVS